MNGVFFYSVSLGLCAGIAAGMVWGVSLWAVGACVFLAVAALIAAALVRASNRKKSARAVIAAAVLSAAALGLVRANIFLSRWDAQTLPMLAHGQTTTVVGKVVSDPDRRDTTTHATLVVSRVGNTQASGQLVAFLPPDAKVEYGDSVMLSGTLDSPEPFEGDAGNIFDYPNYLETQGTSATLSFAQITASRPHSGFSPLGMLYAAKARFNESLERLLPEPESSLMEGILLGERRGLSDSLTAAFVAAGLIHIVILAGYVLSIVSDATLRGLGFLPQKFRYPLAGALLILFVLMTGAAATTVRASIMASVSLVARYFNRSSVALRSLALAAMLMALWNPTILVWDSSFIISALATFGLITLSPAVEHWLRFVPERHELRAIATSTLCVQLFALPALLFYTGNLSFLSVPANLLALPVLPWAMLAGFVGGLLNFLPGLFGFALSLAPALLAWLALKWILFVVWLVSLVPYSSTTITAFPAWLAFLIYIPLIAYAIRVYRSSITPQL